MGISKLLAPLFVSWAEDCGWLEIVPATTLRRFLAYTDVRRAIRSAENWNLLFMHFAFPDARHSQTLADQMLARILLGQLERRRQNLAYHFIYSGVLSNSDVAAAKAVRKHIEEIVELAITEGRVYRLSGGRGAAIDPIRNWWEG